MSPRPVAPRRRRPLSLEALEERLVLTADPLYPVYPLPTYPSAQAIEPPASTTPPVGPLTGLPTADQGPPPPALPLPVSPTGEMPPYPMYPPTTGASGPTASMPATPPPLAAYPPTTPPAGPLPGSVPPSDDVTASAAVPTSLSDLRLYRQYRAAVQVADAAYADAVIAAYTAYQAAAGVADTDHAAALDRAAADWADALFGLNGEELPEADRDAAGAAYDLAEAEADADWRAAEAAAWETFQQQEQAAAIVRAVTEDAAWTAWITAGMPAGSEPNRANQISPVVGMLLGLISSDYTPTRDWARQALQLVDGGADMGEVREELGEMPTRPAGEPSFSLYDTVDGFFAAYANVLTFHQGLHFREYWFGTLATRNHTGTAFWYGHFAGEVHSLAFMVAGWRQMVNGMMQVGPGSGQAALELVTGSVSTRGIAVLAEVTAAAAPGLAVQGVGAIQLAMAVNNPPNGGGGDVTSNWPWKNTQPSISQLTAKGGRCQQWAKKIQQKIGGDVIKIIPDPAKAPGAQFIGPVRNQSGQLISSNFQDHYAVRIGERIYDRITGPQGMHINDYMRLFEWADDLLFNNVVM